jgi:hypothetical protein
MNKKNIDISKRPIPCTECGACCNYFTIKFDLKYNPQVPKNRIIMIKNEGYMKGAHHFKGKCNAITGEIGKDSLCEIYENRPDVCKAFPVWLPDGTQNPRCVKAREFHGLKGKIDFNDD